MRMEITTRGNTCQAIYKVFPFDSEILKDNPMHVYQVIVIRTFITILLLNKDFKVTNDIVTKKKKDSIEQGSANYSSQAKSVPLLVL